MKFKKFFLLLFITLFTLTSHTWAEDLPEVNHTKQYTVLVLDTSGSMEGQPMSSLKDSTKKFIETVDPSNQIAIIQLTGSAKKIIDFTNDKSSLENAVDSLGAGGNTSALPSLKLAKELLDPISGDEAKNIVFFSDGSPADRSNSLSYKDENLSEINIYTIGFFQNLDDSNRKEAQDFLEKLSNRKYYNIDNIDDFYDTFQDVANDIEGKSNNFIFEYNGQKFPLVAYNDFDDNSSWTNVYQPFLIESGDFDWAQAIVSGISANQPSANLNPNNNQEFYSDPNNDKAISGINLFGDILSMANGFVSGGRGGITYLKVYLQTNGTENRMLIMYGNPLESTYGGKTRTYSEILTNWNRDNSIYFLRAEKDADKSIRNIFKGLQGDGRYNLSIKFSKYKEFKDYPYKYTVVIGDDGRVYQYPIFHKGTQANLTYLGNSKNDNYQVDVTQLLNSEKIEIKEQIGKDVKGFLNTYQPQPPKVSFFEKIKKWFMRCPVNVEIYDGNTKIATLIDGQESYIENENGTFACEYDPYTGEYEKTIYTPTNKNYTYKIIGTNTGSLDLTTVDYNENDSTLHGSYNIPITNKTVIWINSNENKVELDEDDNGTIDEIKQLPLVDSNMSDDSNNSESNQDTNNSSSNTNNDTNNKNAIAIYRLYNPMSGEHLFTADLSEYNILGSQGWTKEGIGWNSSNSGEPVYRLYSPVTGEHLYTKDLNEHNVLLSNGNWVADFSDKPIMYSYGTGKVYRLYHEGIRMHLLTKDQNENNVLGSQGWKQEGVGLNCLIDSEENQQPSTKPNPPSPSQPSEPSDSTDNSSSFSPTPSKDYNITYSGHFENLGWIESEANGTVLGSQSSNGNTLEAISINLDDSVLPVLGLDYSVYVENKGWQPYVTNGTTAGTVGVNKKITGLKVKINGSYASVLDVYYRVYVVGKGWTDWVHDDQISGSPQLNQGISGVQIMLSDTEYKLD